LILRCYTTYEGSTLKPCDETGTFSKVEYKDALDGDLVALPSWISRFENPNNKIQVFPISADVVESTHYIYSSWTPNIGTLTESPYLDLQFTVVCQVDHFDVVHTLSFSPYYIYLNAQEFNFEGVSYVQEPACGFGFSTELSF